MAERRVRVLAQNGVDFAGTSGQLLIQMHIPRGAGFIDFQRSYFEAEVTINQFTADSLVENLGNFGLHSCIRRIRVSSGGVTLQELDDADRLMDVVELSLKPDESDSLRACAGDPSSFISSTGGSSASTNAGTNGLMESQSICCPPSGFVSRNQTGGALSVRRTPRLQAMLRVYGGIFDVAQWPALAAPLDVEIELQRKMNQSLVKPIVVCANIGGAPSNIVVSSKSYRVGGAGEPGEFPFYVGEMVILARSDAAGPPPNFTYTRRKITNIALTGAEPSTLSITLDGAAIAADSENVSIRPALDNIASVSIKNPALNLLQVPGDPEKLMKAVRQGLTYELKAFRSYRRVMIGNEGGESISYELAERDVKALFGVLFQEIYIGNQLTQPGPASGEHITGYAWNIDGRSYPDQFVVTENPTCAVHHLVSSRGFAAAEMEQNQFPARKISSACTTHSDGVNQTKLVMAAPIYFELPGVEKTSETGDMRGKNVRLDIQRSNAIDEGVLEANLFVVHNRVCTIRSDRVEVQS